MKTKVLLLCVFTVIAFTVVGCKESTIISSNNNTKLLFYTNAYKALEGVNCPIGDIEIYIDSIYKGKVEYDYFLDNEPINCVQEIDTVIGKVVTFPIIIENESRKLKYLAKTTLCNFFIEGEISVKLGQCNKIFLDFTKL